MVTRNRLPDDLNPAEPEDADVIVVDISTDPKARQITGALIASVIERLLNTGEIKGEEVCTLDLGPCTTTEGCKISIATIFVPWPKPGFITAASAYRHQDGDAHCEYKVVSATSPVEPTKCGGIERMKDVCRKAMETHGPGYLAHMAAVRLKIAAERAARAPAVGTWARIASSLRRISAWFRR